jgi:hypothetical protein
MLPRTLHHVAALVVVVIAACGPSARTGADDGDDGSGDGGSGSGGCPLTCSSDLHDVVDCHGTVVTTCTGDTACGGGVCMSPCDAAAQNQSSIGCDYFAVDPDVIVTRRGACFAAYVANTWTTPVTIEVERDGQSLPIDAFSRIPSGQGQGMSYVPLVNGELAAGQVAILFLASFGGQACPSGVTPAITTSDAAIHGTGRGSAFRIKATAPVVAYDIYPYGGGSSAVTSATLLLPTSAWDESYVAVDAYAKTAINEGQPFVEVVGQHDGTTVMIQPTAAIVGGTGVAAAAQGATATYSLNTGEVLQFTQDAELAGSAIVADQPVGVWGGASCLNIDISTAACDAAHQQLPPVNAMGYRYFGVRYRNRYTNVEENVPWRVVGAVDGTTLTYTPSAPFGAPTTLARGQVAEFFSSTPFVVSSQDADHAFYMSGHMSGCQTYGDLDDCRGDPEFVNVVPPEQYLASYTFFTDPTYPETNLVFTRERQNGTFADINLDCLGTVGTWIPIDAADTMEYARVDLVTGNFASVNGCNNGLHLATSTQPFGLVVWGWGSALSTGFYSQAVSYAYPAGASVKPINNVIIL